MAISLSREPGTGWQSDLSEVAQPGRELRHGSLNPECSATWLDRRWDAADGLRVVLPWR